MIELGDISQDFKGRGLYRVYSELGISIERDRSIPGYYHSIMLDLPNFNENLIPSSTEQIKDDPYRPWVTSNYWFDMNPIGIVFDYERADRSVLMLNLKGIPPQYRAKLILTHLNLIERDLRSLNFFSEIEAISLEERMRSRMAMNRVTPGMLQELTGLNLRHLISAYDVQNISTTKVLDWDHVGETIFCDSDLRGIITAPSINDPLRIFEDFENKQLI